MSERQAKKVRKQAVAEPQKKKADKSKVIFNIIAVLVVLAFAGLAGYAISGVIKDAQSEVTSSTEASTEASNVDTSTLKGYAESMEMTYEEMAEKYGLDAAVFNADMATEEAANLFTIENFAKMNEKDTEAFISELGLPADVQTNVANTELSTDVMMKINGVPYTLEELKEYGLSADITAETKWADAQESVMTAASQRYQVDMEAAEASEEASAAETDGAVEEDGGAE